jgi:DNA invertase Pin-like site-specific DNA recombinase
VVNVDIEYAFEQAGPAEAGGSPVRGCTTQIICYAERSARDDLRAQQREGFKQLMASVAMGEIGIVLSRELSRLSRTDKDWRQLMELCQLFNTLIADADNLYDLDLLDDQLVLGIKGRLSVVEFKVLKLRLLQGREEKAKRGELPCTHREQRDRRGPGAEPPSRTGACSLRPALGGASTAPPAA